MNQESGQIRCTNCESLFEGNYCPACGEKKFEAHDLSLKHVFEETLEGLFHFDNKFFRSFKVLFTKPGLLSLDYVSGRKTRYVKPFQFFLIVNLIFFLLPVSNPYSLPLNNYLTYRPFIDYNTQQLVEKKIAKEETTYPLFEMHFNEQIHVNSKAFILLFIPAYALLLGLLFINKRRKIAEHLIFATHYQSFILVAFVVIPFFAEIIFSLTGTQMNGDYSEVLDKGIVIAFGISLSSYLFFAFKRFYKAHWLQCLVMAVLLGCSYFYLLQYYRMLLFYKIVN